jgi:hypothetical protein
MRRVQPVTLFITIAFLSAGAMMAVVAFNKRALSSGGVGSTEGAQGASPAVLALQSFVPDGLPIILSDVNAFIENRGDNKQAFVSFLRFRAVALGGDQLTSLNLMAFEFDSAGKLRQVDGWIKPIDLSSGKAAEITLPLERRLPPGNRLLLAVERAGGATGRWETNFIDLAHGSASVIAGGRSPTGLARHESPAPDDTGAAICSNAFRRAMALANSGEKSDLTSFTCNQHKRSFSFSFNGKSLSKPAPVA